MFRHRRTLVKVFVWFVALMMIVSFALAFLPSS